jgi:hypothetical protein
LFVAFGKGYRVDVLLGVGVVFCGLASLAGEVLIRLQIVDGMTQVPISGAVVSVRDGAGNFESVGESTNGVLAFSYRGEAAQLRIEARDYANLGARLYLTNSRADKRIEMDRSVPFEGVAIGPSGHWASGGRVALLSKRSHATVRPDGSLATDAKSVSVGAGGSFRLQVVPEGEWIVVVHDLGLASVRILGWTNGTRVQLRPWVFARGKMMINEKVAANEGISAGSVRFAESSARVLLDEFEAQTDEAGNFFFNRLPPGEVSLEWKILRGARAFSFSHTMPFVLEPALNKTLNYHLRGRTIRGKITVEGVEADGNAELIFADLFTKPQQATEFSPLGNPGSARHFALEVDASGRFLGKAVPGGDYLLRVRTGRGAKFKSFQGRMEVVEGDGELDLGEVKVTNGR